MKSLANILEELLTSKYMAASLGRNCLVNVKLLENGKYTRQNLLTEWLNNKEYIEGEHIPIPSSLNISSEMDASLIPPGTDNPAIKKRVASGFGICDPKDNFFKNSMKTDDKTLITDYIINNSKVFECFHHIQRQRKLWWIRFSENPSSIFIDSSTKDQNSQNITIKTKFPFASINMEEITLAYHENGLNCSENSVLSKKDSHIQPSLIRSTIHLDQAVRALLLDSCISSPQGIISLNQKLVPSQCAFICQGNDLSNNLSTDLEDLRSHLTHVLTHAGIRIFNKENITTDRQLHLDAYFSSFGRLGVPYVIIIDERSLRDGLLKLRNRDTSLQETIHISDLPMYLLQLINIGPVR